MKTVILLGLGVLVGLGIYFTAQHPKQAQQQAQQAVKQAKVTIDQVEVKVEGITRDHCVRQFLDETSCYQKHSQKECAIAIEAKCGK